MELRTRALMFSVGVVVALSHRDELVYPANDMRSQIWLASGGISVGTRTADKALQNRLHLIKPGVVGRVDRCGCAGVLVAITYPTVCRSRRLTICRHRLCC